MKRAAFATSAAAAAVALGVSRNALKPAALEVRDAPSAPSTVEIKTALDALMKTVTDERATNEERLKELEKRGAIDPLTVDKVGKIDAAMTEVRAQLDALEARMKRAGAPREGNEEIPGADPEYRKSFHEFLRRGDQMGKEAQQRLEKRAMSVGDNTDGGYLTNVELDRELAKLARDSSPARQIFSVRQIGGTAFKKPISKSNANAGWVGETDGRPQTNTADLGEIAIPTHEIYAMPGATQSILDDAYINIEEYIASEAVDAFDDEETDAFFNGNGVNKPLGLLSLATTEESGSTRAAHGKLGIVKSGSTTTFGSYLDKFVDLISRVRSKYRQGARFVYNGLTEAVIRKVKDSDNNYMWQPSNQLGVPASFLGYASVVCDHMPDIADGAIPVLFGDTRKAYLIVDRVGIRTLRDPFTAKPYVLFYMTKRVGGGPLLTEAVKGLQTAA